MLTAHVPGTLLVSQASGLCRRPMSKTHGLCPRHTAHVPGPWLMFYAHCSCPRHIARVPGPCQKPMAYVPGTQLMFQAHGSCSRPIAHVPGPWLMFQAHCSCSRPIAHVPGSCSRPIAHVPSPVHVLDPQCITNEHQEIDVHIEGLFDPYSRVCTSHVVEPTWSVCRIISWTSRAMKFLRGNGEFVHYLNSIYYASYPLCLVGKSLNVCWNIWVNVKITWKCVHCNLRLLMFSWFVIV